MASDLAPSCAIESHDHDEHAHQIDEDCMTCVECSACDETLDDDDVCDSCRTDEAMGAAYAAKTIVW